MKKADLFMLLGVVLLSCLSLCCFWFTRARYGQKVVITSQQNEIGVYELQSDRTIIIPCGEAYNVVEIKDNHVRVVESDCKNQICVQTHAISNSGESIVCLPHKLIVTIE